MKTRIISISPEQAADVITTYVQNSGISPELIGSYKNTSESGETEVILLIFEKYYIRNSSRASMSVLIENLGSHTAVSWQGSGGGEYIFFKFDWGASSNFENLVWDAIMPYQVQE